MDFFEHETLSVRLQKDAASYAQHLFVIIWFILAIYVIITLQQMACRAVGIPSGEEVMPWKYIKH